MGIDYNADIASLFASDVGTDPNFEAPGNFGIPAGFGSFGLDPSSVIDAAGTSYEVGDTLTLTGGTKTTAAQIGVTGVSGGEVTSFSVLIPGVYSVLPSNPVSVSGGHGSGFELTATWDGYAAQRILCFVSLMSSYMSEVTSVYEMKLLQTIMRRMIAEMKFGYTFDATTISTDALANAMNYIAGDGSALTGSNLDYGIIGPAYQFQPL
jgi:hypothetical protein